MTNKEIDVNGAKVSYNPEEFHHDEVRKLLTPEAMAKLLMSTPNLQREDNNKKCQCTHEAHGRKCLRRTTFLSGYCRRCTENGHI